jgi:hypothetical protein
MKVLKFGGTSVGSAANIKRVKDIVLNSDGSAQCCLWYRRLSYGTYGNQTATRRNNQ